MKFHHVGIPTALQHDKESFLEGANVFVTDPADDAYQIEWLRFLPDSPLPDQLKTMSHLAFQVDDLAATLVGKQILIEPFSPFEGRQVAFVLHDGVPVEFLQDN